MKSLLLVIVSVLLTLGGTACSAPTTQTPEGVPHTTPAAPGAPMRTATVTPVRPAQPAITATAAVTPTGDLAPLVWWAPEFLSPKAPQPAGPLLAKQIADFEATQDGKLHVNVIVKARYGKGGLLDYLRTAQLAAPGLLPDVVALDVVELEQAAGLGLLRPLDGLLDPALQADLYPFARQSGVIGDQSLAVVYLADVEHVIFNRTQVTEAPSTWTGLVTGKLPYLFPAGSPQPLSSAVTTDDVQRSFFSQYLSAGATFAPRARHLTIQEQPLARVLTFYADARQAGVLPNNIAAVTSLDDTWTAYTQGLAPLADVSARRYLAGRDGLKDTGYAAAPGWSTPVYPVASGWALAITTADPTRQRAAAALIAWLIAPEHVSAFAKSAGWLPPSPQALSAWGADPYFEFLGGQLANASPHPIGPDYGPTGARLQRAVLAVLKTGTKPADAVQAALGASK